jgi:transposase
MNFMESFRQPIRRPAETPYVDESLLGFAHRCLDRTVFRRLERAMSAAGLAQQPETLPMIEFTDEQALALVELLDCAPDSVLARAYRATSWRGDRAAAIDFFGVKVRKHYRERSIRRVSPRALSVELYHRAVWDLRPFCFDPRTRERLLDTCPVCGTKLGWKQVHAPQRCGKCFDERGFHSVDLRDYPQPLVEVEDVEALDFATGLVDPDPEVRSGVRRLLPTPWQDFPNDEIFEAVVAMTTGLRKDPSLGKLALARGRTLADFEGLTPELLALAGRAVIGSGKGFSALAARYRADMDKRPGFYGSEKELGQLGRLPSDDDLSPELRQLLKSLIEADMAVNGSFNRIMGDQTKGRDFLPLYRLAEEFGINKHNLERIANSGRVRTIRAADADRSPVQMSRTDLLPLVQQFGDATSSVGAAKRLGIPLPALEGLADRGLIVRLDGAVAGFLEGGAGYSVKSIEQLRDRIWGRAKPKGSRTTVSLPYAARSLGAEVELPWAAIVAAIAAGDVEVFAGGDKRGTIRQSLVVADVKGFLAGVRRHMQHERISIDEWISASTAAEILKVSDPLFYRLVGRRPDLLKAAREGSKPFRRADVEAAARKLVFTAEVAEKTMESVRGVRKLLARLGIEPVVALEENKDLAYDRGAVEPVLETLLETRRKRLAELPEESDDPRVKLIRAVFCDGQPPRAVAEELGVTFLQAKWWLETWKSTGQMAAKKGRGQRRRYPFDDHLDFVRSRIKANPDATLRELTAALATRSFKCGPQGLQINLSRHGLVLKSVIEARRKNGQDKIKISHTSD